MSPARHRDATGTPPQAAAAIYVITPGEGAARHVALSLERLAEWAHRLVVVALEADEAALRAAGSPVAPDRFVRFASATRTPLAGLKAALAKLRSDPGAKAGPVVFTASDTFGPLEGASWPATEGGPDLYAPYWYAPGLDEPLAGSGYPDRIAYLDYAVFGPEILAHDGFWAFWQRFQPGGGPWSEFLAGPAAFARWMQAEGLSTGYPCAEGALETADPRITEIHKLVAGRAPCIPAAVFTLDPLLHDLNATYLRDALDELRTADPALYAAVMGFVGRHVPLREFNSAADQYEVLSEAAAGTAQQRWDFGPVAIFIHVYYPSMMPEFWDLTRRIPGPSHLYLTVPGEAEKARVATYLTERGLDADAFTVRVVAQNRGRDMSSLFITWRDIVLEGRHQVALRLHSKRTPQVNRQVGESFKRHLFDNLVASPGYVANLFDLIEREPDIGLVIPPVIHIGFGTLGHSWFNNKGRVQELCRELGIDVPLDAHTPVAPYGTMYWFRTDALRRMFEWEWRWEDYNLEPHHVDGGLAHVQERLIGYAAQGRGYRVLTVMTPGSAARNYAKLEYKMQFLTSHLMTGHILTQAAQLRSAEGWRIRLFRLLQRTYGQLLVRHPGLRGALRPAKRLAVLLLVGRS